MARQPRIEYKGACYHVLSRGDRDANIFNDDDDRLKFLEKTGEVIDKYNIRVHCYALMDDHFHMLMETPEGNLSRSMHQLNSSYSNWFKSKYRIKGSVFSGRYRSVLVEKNGYLLLLSAFLHLHPVRSGQVARPEAYAWSSYTRYIGRQSGPSWLFLNEILSHFDGKPGAYRTYVQNWQKTGQTLAPEEVFGKKSVLGQEKFRRMIARRVQSGWKNGGPGAKPAFKSLRMLQPEDISRILARKFKIKKDQLTLKRKGNPYRKLYLYGLKKYSDLRLREIGALVDMDYVAVSQMVRRFVLEAKQNVELGRMLDKLEKEIRRHR